MNKRLEGRKLYERMIGTELRPVIETAVRECGCKDEQEAQGLLTALLQWFSLIPMLRPGEALQMLRKVDPVWHAFILNTKLYRDFCEEFIGYYVDHDPMEVTNAAIPKETYAELTLRLLHEEFGQETAPSLELLAEGATCCYFKGSSRPCKSQTSTVACGQKLVSIAA